jgi:hypothetical protein
MRPSVAFDMVGGYGCGESGIKEVSRAGRQGAGRKTNGETFFSASTGFYVGIYGQLGLDPWQIKRNS